jgi:glycosyltransferase involved in cell wall biosynthesis
MDQMSGRRITFLTTGDIRKIATMKRALGMAGPLADLGWEVSIVAMDCSENRSRISASCDARIEVVYFKEGSAFSERRQKSRIIRALGPDILYCCSYSFRNRCGRSDLRPESRLVVEHSELASAILGLPRVKRWLYAYYEWLSVKRADMIVAASRWLQEFYLNRSLPSGKKSMPVTYLPYAHDIDLEQIDADASEQLRSKYKDAFNLVFLGSMIRNYGLFLMLEAIRQLRDDKNKYKLHLIGDGPDLDEARNYIRTHDISHMVVITGYLPEASLSAYLQMADAFLVPLYPTIQDQARCPSKTYMYLPFQKPVLTCRIGESAALFEDDRFFFRSGNPSDLADKVRALRKDVRIPLPDPAHHSWKERAHSFHLDVMSAWKD